MADSLHIVHVSGLDRPWCVIRISSGGGAPQEIARFHCRDEARGHVHLTAHDQDAVPAEESADSFSLHPTSPDQQEQDPRP